MNQQEARTFLGNRKHSTQNIDTPFWSEKDGDGNEIGLQGKLVLRDTPEAQVFAPSDQSLILSIDITDMAVIHKAALLFNGLISANPVTSMDTETPTTPLDEAKKN